MHIYIYIYIVQKTPSWKNGWTESAAREHCESIILENPAQIDCQKYISMEKSTDIAVEECILDIRVFADIILTYIVLSEYIIIFKGIVTILVKMFIPFLMPTLL